MSVGENKIGNNEMTTATCQPIIKAAEVWCATEDSNSLRPTSSVADVDDAVAKHIVERTVADLAPIILVPNDIESSNGSTKDLIAIMGVPIICENKVKATVVLSIVCPEDSMAAFEIWSRDDRDELGLNGAVFARLSRFASISQHVKFPRGSGLPGIAWEEREARLLTGLGTSPNFMRAAGARAGGLDVGVALPIMRTEHDLNSVVLLLSSESTPIARVFEIWDVTGDEAKLRVSESNSCKFESRVGTTATAGTGLIGNVLSNGQPVVSNNLKSLRDNRLSTLPEGELTTAIVIPIYVGEFLKSIFVMLN